jgi:hypothetical protein
MIQEIGLNYALVPKKKRFIGISTYKDIKTNYYNGWNHYSFALMDCITYALQMKNVNIIYDGEKRRYLDNEVKNVYTGTGIENFLKSPVWITTLNISDKEIRLNPMFKNRQSSDIMNLVERTSSKLLGCVYGIRCYDDYSCCFVKPSNVRVDKSNLFDVGGISKKRNNNTYRLIFRSELAKLYSYNVSVFNFVSVGMNFYDLNEMTQHIRRFTNFRGRKNSVLL